VNDPFLEDWERLFATNPKVLWGLVADIAKAVKAGEGERRTGRRPAVAVRSLDELYEVLFPDTYVDEPFPLALAHALDKQRLSQRSFAEKVGFNQATVSRLLSGKTPPTVEMMERIGHCLNVRPTYFVEYRAMKLGQVVTSVMLANPEMSIATVRRLAGATT
jgi:DNA-binding Xre family transcriptional regulator